MNILVKTFRNPFSFFCIAKDSVTNDITFPQSNVGNPGYNIKMDLSGVNHGQYVAVLWNKKWARGIISMESQFLIWLVDYGIYLRPTENTIYINLPSEYKKYPTKVFEASIHGVTPIDKVLNDICQIENEVATTWNRGAIEKAQALIDSAVKIVFMPVALLSTAKNDVVLGDLYLEIKDKGIINIVDELELWPVFLQKNKETYISNLQNYYISHKQHPACLLKPAFPDINLRTMSLQTTLTEYNAICANTPQFEYEQKCESLLDDGSTYTSGGSQHENYKNAFKLTPSEIEKYSKEYITVNGREYNVLNVLLNKARDLYMCELYKDAKSVGRATTRLFKPTETRTGWH